MIATGSGEFFGMYLRSKLNLAALPPTYSVSLGFDLIGLV